LKHLFLRIINWGKNTDQKIIDYNSGAALSHGLYPHRHIYNYLKNIDFIMKNCNISRAKAVYLEISMISGKLWAHLMQFFAGNENIEIN
jgi:hypothetical protein